MTDCCSAVDNGPNCNTPPHLCTERDNNGAPGQENAVLRKILFQISYDNRT